MKKIIIAIVIIIIFVIIANRNSSKKVEKNTVQNDPARVEKCQNALAFMTFPDGASADDFLRRCSAGEKVLPEEMVVQ